jgi:hypothetical protein
VSEDRRRDALDVEYEGLLDEVRAQLGLPPREPVAESVPSITCPRCGRTSHHPVDVREGYCGACHDWTSRPGDERVRPAGRRGRGASGGESPRPAPEGEPPPALGEGAGGGSRGRPRRRSVVYQALLLGLLAVWYGALTGLALVLVWPPAAAHTPWTVCGSVAVAGAGVGLSVAWRRRRGRR